MQIDDFLHQDINGKTIAVNLGFREQKDSRTHTPQKRINYLKALSNQYLDY
ncbi:MAG: hypothetical protein V7K98_12025 [Nostoc sp.]|uniref:hypothetical protein n=1 Tax=Nostoc sp. TaxID=1180 RepID=UPI002FF9E5F2